MNSALGQKTLEIAESEIGQKEATGHNDGPFVEMLDRWMDEGAGWMKGQPWCITFALWCVYRAALALGIKSGLPKFDGTSGLYAWFKAHGLLLTAPVPNCLGMVRGNGGTPGKTHHHTFIVKAVRSDGFVDSVDGNISNSVCRNQHAIADCDFGPIM